MIITERGWLEARGGFEESTSKRAEREETAEGWRGRRHLFYFVGRASGMNRWSSRQSARLNSLPPGLNERGRVRHRGRGKRCRDTEAGADFQRVLDASEAMDGR